MATTTRTGTRIHRSGGFEAGSGGTPAAAPAADLALAELGLPVRVVNFLEARGCLWLPELFAYYPDEVARWPRPARTFSLIFKRLQGKHFRQELGIHQAGGHLAADAVFGRVPLQHRHGELP